MPAGTGPLRTITPTLDIYIKLAQYPILADKIRARMRRELFERGVVTEEKFNAEVKEKAIESQQREGVYDPFVSEPATTWNRRIARIRDYHSDFYFGHSFPTQLFEDIVAEIVNKHTPRSSSSILKHLNFNPELAPWEMLFQQGEMYEQLPPEEQEQFNHHLEEIKVVLIKGMISDQLRFIGVAKQVFSIADLRRIYARRIGGGKIGGKAAGMLLAWKILSQQDNDFGPDLSDRISIPDSYFLGTDVIYDFRTLNNIDGYMNQKYLPLEKIRAQHDSVIEAHLRGEFPEDIVEELQGVLDMMDNAPLIVRSSSLLEDNFGFAFAGKYNSYFCPNQGTPEENLKDLLNKIKLVYASTANPDAILYRKEHGLIDYDERMAILIQKVEGQTYGKYFFPAIAGVGFSQNPFRWHPKIRREEGFLRIVVGMGTRAVNRVEQDYPRLIPLSHPQLRPETNAEAIKLYSQSFMDAIDLEENKLKSLPISDVINLDFPLLRYVASVKKNGYIQALWSSMSSDPHDELVLTFDYLTKDEKFTKLMRTALMRLEHIYKTPVDTEFTVEVIPNYPYPQYRLHILQCRPLSQRKTKPVSIPTNIPEENIVFHSYHLIPDGAVEQVRYIIFVDPAKYHSIPEFGTRLEIGRAIGRLNHQLEGRNFIIMGPGRWGSSNIELGVKVSYADIHNTKVLIEMAVPNDTGVPELSYGTHFFQDLVEAGIYSLPLHLENPKSVCNWDFFSQSSNVLAEISTQDAALAPFLKVIDLAKETDNYRLNIFMDGSRDEAVGFLVDGNWRVDVNGSNVSVPA